MTIKELRDLCNEQIDQGNGHKEIVISDDLEENSFHMPIGRFDTAESVTKDGKAPIGVEKNMMLLG